MREKAAKLINVKSIVTIILTGVFAYLAAAQKIPQAQFVDIFKLIIVFYFGTQVQKNQDEMKG